MAHPCCIRRATGSFARLRPKNSSETTTNQPALRDERATAYSKAAKKAGPITLMQLYIDRKNKKIDAHVTLKNNAREKVHLQ